MSGISLALPAIIGVCVLLHPALTQDHTAELRARFERESDPVRKAKWMLQLGDTEYADLRQAVSAGNLEDALSILTTYRQEARICQKALDERGVNAEKKPAGFKQLQISVREMLRRLDEVLAGITIDEQRPFLKIRADLEDLNRHLVEELFPRGPGLSAEPEKPKN